MSFLTLGNQTAQLTKKHKKQLLYLFVATKNIGAPLLCFLAIIVLYTNVLPATVFVCLLVVQVIVTISQFKDNNS